MRYSDDSFAAMLLTMALSPNRAEYARPLSTAEYRQLELQVASVPEGRMGRLLGLDISGLMRFLRIPEEEAYRIFVLLNRGVQLSYALEGFLKKGIEVVSLFDESYPDRLKRRMRESAPPILFFCGDRALLELPSVAVMGISGVRTTPGVRQSVEALVQCAKERGYAILTGGEPGVSRVAAGLARDLEAVRIDVLGGGMEEHLSMEGNALLIGAQRALAVSMEHPEALFTVSHAITRNKLAFALADAAFVFNTDLKRGETDALKNRLCNWIYAYSEWPQARALFSRGAIPFSTLTGEDAASLFDRWKNSRCEQMSVFDLLGGEE